MDHPNPAHPWKIKVSRKFYSNRKKKGISKHFLYLMDRPGPPLPNQTKISYIYLKKTIFLTSYGPTWATQTDRIPTLKNLLYFPGKTNFSSPFERMYNSAHLKFVIFTWKMNLLLAIAYTKAMPLLFLKEKVKEKVQENVWILTLPFLNKTNITLKQETLRFVTVTMICST